VDRRKVHSFDQQEADVAATKRNEFHAWQKNLVAPFSLVDCSTRERVASIYTIIDADGFTAAEVYLVKTWYGVDLPDGTTVAAADTPADALAGYCEWRVRTL
jgi:hypothetical protein